MCNRQLLVLSALLICPVLTRAQPFVSGGVSSFTPQIDTINDGVKNDVQATVSSDRKYVTLTMRPQQAQLLNLFEFQFQGPPLATGFVGGVNFAPDAPAAGAFGVVNPPVALAPGRGGAILAQRGMTRIIGP